MRICLVLVMLVYSLLFGKDVLGRSNRSITFTFRFFPSILQDECQIGRLWRPKQIPCSQCLCMFNRMSRCAPVFGCNPNQISSSTSNGTTSLIPATSTTSNSRDEQGTGEPVTSKSTPVSSTGTTTSGRVSTVDSSAPSGEETSSTFPTVGPTIPEITESAKVTEAETTEEGATPGDDTTKEEVLVTETNETLPEDPTTPESEPPKVTEEVTPQVEDSTEDVTEQTPEEGDQENLRFRRLSMPMDVCDICGRYLDNQNSQPREAPWRAQLIVHTSGIGYHCGGVIIDRFWILTAAHCFPDLALTPEWKTTILAGRKNSSEEAVFEMDNALPDVIRHESFTAGSPYYDIALLNVPYPGLEFAPNKLAPICLPDIKSIPRAFIGTWEGYPLPNGTFSEQIFKTNLEVYNAQDCNRFLNNHQLSSPVHEQQICTASTAKDTCPGESGGSIDYKAEGGRSFSIGISRFGLREKCDQVPSVHTNVAYFSEWIAQKSGVLPCSWR